MQSIISDNTEFFTTACNKSTKLASLDMRVSMGHSMAGQGGVGQALRGLQGGMGDIPAPHSLQIRGMSLKIHVCIHSELPLSPQGISHSGPFSCWWWWGGSMGGEIDKRTK